jgi:hypothetical protein
MVLNPEELPMRFGITTIIGGFVIGLWVSPGEAVLAFIANR